MSKKNLSPIDADFAGIFFKPIAHYLENPDVAEVMVNAHDDIWVEDNDGLRKVPEVFTQDALVSAVNSLAQYVGRPLQEHVFSIDARMPDGSRVCIVLPPVSGQDPIFAIRRFKEVVSDLDFLVTKKSLTSEMVDFIDACVKIKKNIMVSGGTSSGKTTLLNLIAAKIPDEDRIITIEDSRELQLQQEHVLSLEGKPADKHGRGEFPIRHCLKSTLRLRPDRIIVGEIRSGEAFDLVQAMNTGHGGCMGTVHANAPTDTLRRIESLALMADVDMPLIALRSMIASALDLIICPARLSDGSRRIVQIAEIGPLTEKGDYTTIDICKFVSSRRNKNTGKIEGYFEFTGHVPSFFDMFEAEGVDVPVEFFRKRIMGEVPDSVAAKLIEQGFEVPGHNAPAQPVVNPAPIQESIQESVAEQTFPEPQEPVVEQEVPEPISQLSVEETSESIEPSNTFEPEPVTSVFEEQPQAANPSDFPPAMENIQPEPIAESFPVQEQSVEPQIQETVSSFDSLMTDSGAPQENTSLDNQSFEQPVSPSENFGNIPTDLPQEPVASSFDDMNQQNLSVEQPVNNLQEFQPAEQIDSSMQNPLPMDSQVAEEPQKKPSILERLNMLGGEQAPQQYDPAAQDSAMNMMHSSQMDQDVQAQEEFNLPDNQMQNPLPAEQNIPAQTAGNDYSTDNVASSFDEYQTNTSMSFDEEVPSQLMPNSSFLETPQPEFTHQNEQTAASFDSSQLNQNVEAFPQGQMQEFNQVPNQMQDFVPAPEQSFQQPQDQQASFEEFEAPQQPMQQAEQPQMQQQDAGQPETKQHAVIAEILKRMRENKSS